MEEDGVRGVSLILEWRFDVVVKSEVKIWRANDLTLEAWEKNRPFGVVLFGRLDFLLKASKRMI